MCGSRLVSCGPVTDVDTLYTRRERGREAHFPEVVERDPVRVGKWGNGTVHDGRDHQTAPLPVNYTLLIQANPVALGVDARCIGEYLSRSKA